MTNSSGAVRAGMRGVGGASIKLLWLVTLLGIQSVGGVQAMPTGSQREVTGRIAVEPSRSTPSSKVVPALVPPAKAPVDRITPPGRFSATAAGDKPARPLKLDGDFASAKRIVPFAFNKVGVGPRGAKAVKELLPLAKKSQKVYVRGRTDGAGNTPSNRKVAHDRAYTVYKAFRNGGVEQKKMRLTYCTQCYVAGNDTEEGRRMNRRVEVEMIMPREEIARMPAPVHAPEAPPQLAPSATLLVPPR